MRFFRTIALGTLLLAGGFFFTGIPADFDGTSFVAHAQTVPPPADPPPADPPPADPPADDSAPTAAKENENLGDSIWSCITDPVKCGLESTLTPIGAIAFLFLMLANAIIALVTGIFDFAVSVLVFQFAVYFGNSAGMLLGWSMLRDIGNILLVFGFVSIGIQTILNVGHYSVGKTLPRLIIFAVLLNFSLFAAEAVIDTSNAISATIFQQAFECGGGVECDGSAISAKILQLTGVSNQFEVWAEFGRFTGNSNKFERIIAIILTTIFVLVTAAVLLFSGLLLGARAIMLAFLMITSPIGFAGMVIPRLEKMAKDWWTALINNALFAPALLMMLFVSLRIAEGVALALPQSNGRIPSVFETFTQGALLQDFGGALVFVLVIGFMFGSLLAAKQFGIFGADFVTKQAGAAIGFSTAGMWARAGRFAIGRPMNRMATSVRASRFGNTLAGDLLAKGLDKGATKSFDVRTAKGNIKIAGVSLGKTGDFSKDGRRGELKKIAERASKDADARKDARKNADRPLEQDIAALGKEAEVEHAKATALRKNASTSLQQAQAAEAAGDPVAAERFRAQATNLEAQAKTHDAAAKAIDAKQRIAKDKLEEQQKGRLSRDERIVQEAKAKGGAAVDEEYKRAAQLDENTRAMQEATTEVAALTEKIGKMNEDERNGYIRPADKPAFEKEREEAVIRLTDAQDRLDGAAATLKKMQESQEAFTKLVKDTRKKEAKRGQAMLKADYALEQSAERFERVARNLERVSGLMSGPLGAASFRTMAHGITKKAGMSEEEELAHKIEHLLHAKGGHGGDGHGDDHADDHGAAAPAKKADHGGGGHGDHH